MSTTMTYDRERGLSPTDRILLRGASANKSANELSELTGGVIKPATAVARVLEILDARASESYLTREYRKLLLIDDLMALKDVLYQRAVDMNDLEAAGPLRAVLQDIHKVLEADKVDIVKAMEQINRAHAQLMLTAISTALERSLLELERRYPEVPKGELVTIFHAAMPDVVKQIESRVPEGQ